MTMVMLVVPMAVMIMVMSVVMPMVLGMVVPMVSHHALFHEALRRVLAVPVRERTPDTLPVADRVSGARDNCVHQY